MYRVRTDQVGTPFDQLQPPVTPSRGGRARSASPELSYQRSPYRHQPSDGALAAALARRTMHERLASGTLFPPPMLNPSAQSAYGSGSQQSLGGSLSIHPQANAYLASLPNANTNDTLEENQIDFTPRKKGQRGGVLDVRKLGTPIKQKGKELTTPRNDCNGIGGLTSSVVKGEAASGLIQLMRGGQKKE